MTLKQLEKWMEKELELWFQRQKYGATNYVSYELPEEVLLLLANRGLKKPRASLEKYWKRRGSHPLPMEKVSTEFL